MKTTCGQDGLKNILQFGTTDNFCKHFYIAFGLGLEKLDEREGKGVNVNRSGFQFGQTVEHFHMVSQWAQQIFIPALCDSNTPMSLT